MLTDEAEEQEEAEKTAKEYEEGEEGNSTAFYCCHYSCCPSTIL